MTANFILGVLRRQTRSKWRTEGHKYIYTSLGFNKKIPEENRKGWTVGEGRGIFSAPRNICWAHDSTTVDTN